MLFALGHVHAERFLAKHSLARFGGGDGDGRVRIVGRGDVDDVDVGVVDDLPPVGGKFFPNRTARRRPRSWPALRPQIVWSFTRGGQVEEAAHLTPGVRMGLAHEVVADHADVELFFHRGEWIAEGCIGWAKGSRQHRPQSKTEPSGKIRHAVDRKTFCRTARSPAAARQTICTVRTTFLFMPTDPSDPTSPKPSTNPLPDDFRHSQGGRRREFSSSSCCSCCSAGERLIISSSTSRRRRPQATIIATAHRCGVHSQAGGVHDTQGRYVRQSDVQRQPAHTIHQAS